MRKQKHKPGNISLQGRSLAVVMQVLLPKFLRGTTKTNRKQSKHMANFVRNLAKSSAEKRAIEGQNLAPPGKLPGKPPMTFKELAEASGLGHLKFEGENTGVSEV